MLAKRGTIPALGRMAYEITQRRLDLAAIPVCRRPALPGSGPPPGSAAGGMAPV